MARGLQRRQKPVWKKVRKPEPPPEKIRPSPKKRYNRKDRAWEKEIDVLP